MKACDDSGLCRADNVLQAICAAAGAVAPKNLVLNLSLGGSTPSRAVELALRGATAAGATAVISAGNQASSNKAEPPLYPAAYRMPGLLSVGSANLTSGLLWQRAPYSRTASVFAPSVNFYKDDLVWIGGTNPGTSFSTAVVSGLVAAGNKVIGVNLGSNHR